ncbi:MAG TPA: trypsin-like peptidase domain-containing protein, partial [Pyrinomonadaceae bacterium]
MIILPHLFYDADAFAEGLRRASRGVLRVVIESGTTGSGPSLTHSTGWLITDDLLVLPNYSASAYGESSEQRYYCTLSRKPKSAIEATLVSGGAYEPHGARPALLRLSRALPRRALSLEVKNIEPGEPVVVLQYPGGEPKLQFSIGRLTETVDAWVRYDANTVAGSGGSPVIGANTWMLVGMHVGASHQGGFNEGLSLASLLDSLRQSAAWDEIARHHRLVDVKAARQTLWSRAKSALEAVQADATAAIADSAAAMADSAAVAAALQWNFDPDLLDSDEREKLRPLVSDPSAPLWALETKERQRLIRSAGSLKALRKVRRDPLNWLNHALRFVLEDEPEREDKKQDELGQRVIDRILKGPPYSLEMAKDTELPYWLQAVRWFADVEPKLPTPAEVNRTLERRRVRSRLLIVAGPDFTGRARELARMRKWYENSQAGPLVISGIGGIGKSSLVAQFASSLTADTILLWLDFDRADLAPDDAESVLTLLSDQMAVQLGGFTAPDASEDGWAKAADALGAALDRQPAPSHAPPLLVLDGFEVAQHAKEHHKIWEVLERILVQAHALRVVVSGRAAVHSLTLCGRPAESLRLQGMAGPDAKSWLRERGITDDKVLSRVVKISNGVPLVLKLAVHWVNAGGKVGELPDELPKTLVEGFLYQRILDRVIDPRLKPIARDALVLRRLTPEMLSVVLHDTIPEGLDAAEVFSLLTREMGLVETDAAGASAVMLGGVPGVLSLRPEVRSATLRLLEMKDAGRVREIDRRAADWYAAQNLSEAANAAELIYHRLRLGDLTGAQDVWRDDCAALLRFAVEELPESAVSARAWLGARTSGVSAQPDNLETWEKEAIIRIHSAIGRGLLSAVPEVLGERSERSASSPLVLYDAWMRWRAKDFKGAREVLQAAGEADSTVGRDRAVLGALLAAHDKDLPAAERLLAGIESAEHWLDNSQGALEALAVRAARVRLTVDLPSELELSKIVQKEAIRSPLMVVLNEFLNASDVMLPDLSRRLGGQWVLETSGSSMKIPANEPELITFAYRLHGERHPNSP